MRNKALTIGATALLAIATGRPAMAQAPSISGVSGIEMVPANAVQLFPAETFVEGRPEAVKFEIDTDGTVQPENANLTLVAMPRRTTHYVEIPFKLAVQGTERMEIACQLSLFRGSFSGIETEMIAATRQSFILTGASAGRVRIGFAPFDAERLAVNLLVGRQRQDSQPMVPVAICRMTAYGAGWSSETDVLDDMLARKGRRVTKLVRSGDGGELAPLVTTASTVVVALPPGYESKSAQPSEQPSPNPLPSGDDLRKKLCTRLHNC